MLFIFFLLLNAYVEVFDWDQKRQKMSINMFILPKKTQFAARQKTEKKIHEKKLLDSEFRIGCRLFEFLNCLKLWFQKHNSLIFINTKIFEN